MSPGILWFIPGSYCPTALRAQCTPGASGTPVWGPWTLWCLTVCSLSPSPRLLTGHLAQMPLGSHCSMPQPPILLPSQGSPISPQLFSAFAMESPKMRVSASFSTSWEKVPQEVVVGAWVRAGAHHGLRPDQSRLPVCCTELGPETASNRVSGLRSRCLFKTI